MRRKEGTFYAPPWIPRPKPTNTCTNPMCSTRSAPHASPATEPALSSPARNRTLSDKTCDRGKDDHQRQKTKKTTGQGPRQRQKRRPHIQDRRHRKKRPKGAKNSDFENIAIKVGTVSNQSCYVFVCDRG